MIIVILIDAFKYTLDIFAFTSHRVCQFVCQVRRTNFKKDRLIKGQLKRQEVHKHKRNYRTENKGHNVRIKK